MPAPQGWYPDPESPGNLRWWDGAAWTDVKTAAAATPPLPARPRRKIWPWILGGLGVLVVLAGIAGAIIIPKIIDSVTAPVDAANEYLKGAKVGGTRESYSRLCAEIRDQVTFEEYRQEMADRIEEHGRLVSYNANGTHRELGKSYASVDVRIVTSRGDRTQIRVLMEEENGNWRWCGYGPALGSDPVGLPII
jgi:hypothetical protein